MLTPRPGGPESSFVRFVFPLATVIPLFQGARYSSFAIAPQLQFVGNCISLVTTRMCNN